MKVQKKVIYINNLIIILKKFSTPFKTKKIYNFVKLGTTFSTDLHALYDYPLENKFN